MQTSMTVFSKIFVAHERAAFKISFSTCANINTKVDYGVIISNNMRMLFPGRFILIESVNHP